MGIVKANSLPSSLTKKSLKYAIGILSNRLYYMHIKFGPKMLYMLFIHPMHLFMAQFISNIACYTNWPFNVKKKTSQKTIKVVKFIVSDTYHYPK